MLGLAGNTVSLFSTARYLKAALLIGPCILLFRNTENKMRKKRKGKRGEN
jgi:hypothetical protein